jgi:hypothetical protein
MMYEKSAACEPIALPGEQVSTAPPSPASVAPALWAVVVYDLHEPSPAASGQSLHPAAVPQKPDPLHRVS